MERYTTDEQVDDLNGARETLREIRAVAQRRSDFNSGAILAVIDAADHAVFSVLNYLDAYGGEPLTPEQIHGRPVAAL